MMPEETDLSYFQKPTVVWSHSCLECFPVARCDLCRRVCYSEMVVEEEVHRNLVDRVSYSEEAVVEGHPLLEEQVAEDHQEVEEGGNRGSCFAELEDSSSAGASN